MSAFTEQWLQLREPFDPRARSGALVDSLRPVLSIAAPIRIVDLGAGIGANLRFLAPLIGGRQQWSLIDNDVHLLAAQTTALTNWAQAMGGTYATQDEALQIVTDRFSLRIETRQLNLASELAALELPERSLVTASALLDLVSGQWLQQLIERCASVKSCCLFALTYDGRNALEPKMADDELVFEHFNMHQRGDKGFGPALGPDAAATARQLLIDNGYAIDEAASDWRIETAAPLQTALLQGWIGAATELAPAMRTRFEVWYRERRSQIDQQALRTSVGHQDIAAWPKAS